MDFKHKKFCDDFLETFDFEKSCSFAQVNERLMLERVKDETSEVSQYLNYKKELFTLASTFITNDFIKYRLGLIVLDGDNQHKIGASKILLDYEDNVDKTSEFLKLIEGIKHEKKSII